MVYLIPSISKTIVTINELNTKIKKMNTITLMNITEITLRKSIQTHKKYLLHNFFLIGNSRKGQNHHLAKKVLSVVAWHRNKGSED